MLTLPSLPSLDGKSPEELLSVLLHEEYGTPPPPLRAVHGETVSTDERFCAGHAPLLTVRLTCETDDFTFSFPIRIACPKGKTKLPALLHLNFQDKMPDIYQPTEELTDEGFAVLTLFYRDVTSDNGDFTDGLAGKIYPDGVQTETGCGKIMMWAWAATAVYAYATTLPEIDPTRISVIGHSRLGKTALLAGALERRFYAAYSNDSGCSGAALVRGADKESAETVKVITTAFPYWFCRRYARYAEKEDEMPFDQHFLLAANVSHLVYVASASLDLWASPENEYRACVAASDYFEAHGRHPFVHPDRLPKVGECFHEGDIGYHLREGMHYLNRTDWQLFLRFLKKKMHE